MLTSREYIVPPSALNSLIASFTPISPLLYGDIFVLFILLSKGSSGNTVSASPGENVKVSGCSTVLIGVFFNENAFLPAAISLPLHTFSPFK